MDLELLRTFLELNRTRHFGRPAEALFVTRAAVSSRLKALEANLGVTLFERTRREMRLPPQGARLVPHSEKMIASWRVARQDVSLAEATEQLLIGGSLRLWDVLLQRWLHDLRRNYPQLGNARDCLGKIIETAGMRTHSRFFCRRARRASILRPSTSAENAIAA